MVAFTGVSGTTNLNQTLIMDKPPRTAVIYARVNSENDRQDTTRQITDLPGYAARLFTDANGTYQLIREVFDGPESVTVIFEDVDGEENGGEFASAEVSPEVKQTEKGDNDWYGGAFEARADVQLKKK